MTAPKWDLADYDLILRAELGDGQWANFRLETIPEPFQSIIRHALRHSLRQGFDRR